MERLKLSVLKRGADKKVPADLKKMIRGVVYGSKVDPFSIWMNAIDFQKVFIQAGENTLIDLETDDANQHVVLVHDVQLSPMRGIPMHADFFVVNMKENVETAVPLEFVGVSMAIKEEGGVLVKNMEEIEVRCLPSDIPKHFVVDLSKLNTFDDCIYVKDIVHSEKYEALLDGESAVALVARPRKEEVEDVTAPESGIPAEPAKTEEKVEEKK